MSVGPNGEKRPRGVIANAVHMARIATGEIKETYAPVPKGHEAGFSRADVAGRGRSFVLVATPHGEDKNRPSVERTDGSDVPVKVKL